MLFAHTGIYMFCKAMKAMCFEPIKLSLKCLICPHIRANLATTYSIHEATWINMPRKTSALWPQNVHCMASHLRLLYDGGGGAKRDPCFRRYHVSSNNLGDFLHKPSNNWLRWAPTGWNLKVDHLVSMLISLHTINYWKTSFSIHIMVPWFLV